MKWNFPIDATQDLSVPRLIAIKISPNNYCQNICTGWHNKTNSFKRRREKKKRKKNTLKFYPLYARMFKRIGIPLKAHCGSKFVYTSTDTQTHMRNIRVSSFDFMLFASLLLLLSLCFFCCVLLCSALCFAWFVSVLRHSRTSCLHRYCESTGFSFTWCYRAPQQHYNYYIHV